MIFKIIHLSIFDYFNCILESIPNIKKEDPELQQNWYVDTKSTIQEHMDTSSSISMVKKMLIRGEEEKRVE